MLLRNRLHQFALCALVLTGFSIPLSVTGTGLCMTLAAVLSVLSGQFTRRFNELRHHPLVLSALWIVLLAAMGVLWSIAPWPDRFGAVHKYAKLLYIPFLWPLCTDAKWRDRTLLAFLLAVTVTVLISCLKFWTGWHIGRFPQPSFVFYTHIETSFLVAVGAFFLVDYGRRHPRWRIGCWILALLFTYQEFFINDGRTGWIVYGVLLFLYAAHCIQWKGLLLGGGIALLLILGSYFFSATFQSTVKKSISDIQQYQTGYVETSLGYRLGFAKLSVSAIKARPLFGYGTGSFGTVYQQRGGLPGWPVLRTPHNEYLMVTVQWGILGLLSLLLLFGLQLYQSFSLKERMFLAQAMLLAFAVSAASNSFLYLSISGHFYVFFTALFYARFRSSEISLP